MCIEFLYHFFIKKWVIILIEKKNQLEEEVTKKEVTTKFSSLL